METSNIQVIMIRKSFENTWLQPSHKVTWVASTEKWSVLFGPFEQMASENEFCNINAQVIYFSDCEVNIRHSVIKTVITKRY